jgi:hypothetical protein
LGLFGESESDKELRLKIAAQEKAKYDAEQLKQKEANIRRQERAKLESGGFTGMLGKQAKKFLKDAGL